jgi:protein TonB
MLRVAKKRAVLWGVIVLLAACGGESDPEQVTATPPAEAQVPAEPPIPDVPTATPASTQQQAADFAAQAEQALREEHMFAPAGSNAFEWFLRAHELDRENVFARDALFDLIPYAVLHIEQRIAARDRAEVERLIPLLQRAQPEAPALPRLQNALSALSPEASPTADSARRPEQKPSVAVTPPPAPQRRCEKACHPTEHCNEWRSVAPECRITAPSHAHCSSGIRRRRCAPAGPSPSQTRNGRA